MIGLSAWWSAWKYVAILALFLALSVWGNWHQHNKIVSAKAECRAQMEKAARIAIERERKRAADAQKRANKIADDEARKAEEARRKAQEHTNDRGKRIESVPTRDVCVMPAGLPDLTPAVDEANAAAGD